MTRYRTLVSSVLLASSLGLFATSAISAPQKGGPSWEGAGFMGQRSERMEQNQKKLHDALKLAPEQEAAWAKLIDSQPKMANMSSMGNMGKGMPDNNAQLTTPERAEKMLELMKVRQTQMTEHVAVMKDFYAVLTPEQKKSFDDFHTSMQGGKRGMSSHRGMNMASPKSQ